MGTPLRLVLGGAPWSNESEAFSHSFMNATQGSGIPKKRRTVKIESCGNDGTNLSENQRKVPRSGRIHIPLEVSSYDGTLLTMQGAFKVDLRVHNLQEGLLNVEYHRFWLGIPAYCTSYAVLLSTRSVEDLAHEDLRAILALRYKLSRPSPKIGANRKSNDRRFKLELQSNGLVNIAPFSWDISSHSPGQPHGF